MSPIVRGPGTAAKYRNGSGARSRSSVRIRPRRRRGLLARPAAAGRWDGLGFRDQAGCFYVAACDTCLASVCGPCWLCGGVVPRLTLAAGTGGQQGLSSGRRLGRGVWFGRHGPGARRGSARCRLEPAARARRQCAPGTGTLAAGVRFLCAAAHLGAEHARRSARPGSWRRGRQAADGCPSDGSGVQAVIGDCGRPD